MAAPSANISTKLSSVQASDVIEEFGSKIKYILNGGKCQIGVESTIINLTTKPTILRFGGLDISKIEKVYEISSTVLQRFVFLDTYYINNRLMYDTLDTINNEEIRTEFSKKIKMFEKIIKMYNEDSENFHKTLRNFERYLKLMDDL